MPKGAKIFQTLQRWIEDEEAKRGYVLTKTPFMSKNDLFKASGHWDHYKDGMFVLGNEETDSEILCLRPMTCPFQFTVYNAEQHSYRDLPIRYNETSTLFRKEASGEMHGLIRIRQFTLAEGHLVCTPEQVEEEFRGVIDLIDYVMSTLGIDKDITYRFSKWDPNNTEKYINNPEAWESTQNQMRIILDHLKINYTEVEGEAAFYGPKLDIQFKNVHGKEDTIITVQIDFALAERLGMSYIDKNGDKKIPFVIHRSSIGCYERTIAMLIEKYAGAFPTWLAPVQVKVLPISDKYSDYAESVVKSLRNKGVSVEADYRAEKIGYKIREARLERIPYILVVGEKEAANNEVSVRSRKNDDEGAIKLDAFIERIVTEIANKER
jgi:threonyl-tRNA synthetase